MSVPDDLEVYGTLSILARLKEGLTGVHVNTIGMRPKTDGLEEWVDFYPVGDLRARSRRANWDGRMLFQFSCNSRIEEGRADHDTVAPQRLAARVRKLFEHVDVPVRKVGAGEDVIACLNFHEARQRYLPRRNITFEGEGNFSVEQGNTHAVVVTVQATLVV